MNVVPNTTAIPGGIIVGMNVRLEAAQLDAVKPESVELLDNFDQGYGITLVRAEDVSLATNGDFRHLPTSSSC